MKLLNFGKKDTIYFIFQEHETKHEKSSYVTTLRIVAIAFSIWNGNVLQANEEVNHNECIVGHHHSRDPSYSSRP